MLLYDKPRGAKPVLREILERCPGAAALFVGDCAVSWHLFSRAVLLPQAAAVAAPRERSAVRARFLGGGIPGAVVFDARDALGRGLCAGESTCPAASARTRPTA